MFPDKASITRFVALIVALLAYFGINVPSTVEEGFVALVFGVYTLYMAYKNNDFTWEAKEGTEHMKELKALKEVNKKK